MNQKALYQITYGLYLLTARADGRDNGCIINTAIQVANNPTRVSVAVIKNNLTHDMIARTGVFNVSAISKDATFSLFQRFGMQSGRDADKFEGFDGAKRSENGLLYLANGACMMLSCSVTEQHDMGSHTLFVGELTAAEALSDVEPCTYAYYQSDIKPKKKAKKGWVCTVCGYVYEGDELPEDYVCPICKHGPEVFQRMDGEEKPAQQKPAQQKPAAGGKKWVCTVCGYVYEGETPPEQCPVCKVPADKFVEQKGEMAWAAEHVAGVAKGCPQEIIDGLRANFEAECSEVGMYLAMARVAHREGYPEIGLYWEKAAYEEAEHAAKFAELLGEVVTDSTRKNLEMRVEAENGATAGKTELAKLAKQLGLDAIHDTVHEMARDEARHGKAFEGLLKRYFG